jgi:hypothetical protein
MTKPTDPFERVRTFPLTTEAGLVLVRQYKYTIDKARDDLRHLQNEYQEKAAALTEIQNAELKTIWRHLAAYAGLDPEATYANPEYGLEVRFLDKGFAAVIYTPLEPHPLEALTGKETGSSDPDIVPPGTTLN